MSKKTVALGGTFETIHRGHRLLLEKALEFDEVLIGLTSDEFVLSQKGRLTKSYDERKQELERLLSSHLPKIRITQIDDCHGFAVTDRNIDAIVVSSETFPTAQEINMRRQSSGMKPLSIIKIPLVYSSDLKKISSERISKGEIDLNGNRLKPLTVILGSTNPNKIEGTAMAFREMLGLDATVSGEKVETYTSQPFDRETIRSAIERAKLAWDSQHDYSVGIESGIFNFEDYSLDIAYAAVYDGETFTLGNSMGFQLPEQVIELVQKGSELGEVIDSLAGTKGIGNREGAISYLSNGKLKRIEMNVQAVKCALIPRVARTILEKEERF